MDCGGREAGHSIDMCGTRVGEKREWVAQRGKRRIYQGYKEDE